MAALKNIIPNAPAAPGNGTHLLHMPALRFDIPVCASLAETAQILTLSRRKVAELVASGKLATKRIGRRRIVPRASIEKLLR